MKYLMWLLKAAIFFTLFAFALNNQQDTAVHFFFGYVWRAPLVLVAVQLSVPESYLPPVFKAVAVAPPHTIISSSVQSAVCAFRPPGAVAVLVGAQLSVPGSYLPPVFT